MIREHEEIIRNLASENQRLQSILESKIINSVKNEEQMTEKINSVNLFLFFFNIHL
jgi:hypothetical protein